MKHLIYILLIGIFSVSCEDFLSVNPANIRSIQSVDDIRGMLGGYLLTIKDPAYVSLWQDDHTWYGIPFFPNGDIMRMFYYYDNGFDPQQYLSQTVGIGSQTYFLQGMEWDMKWVHEKIWNGAYLSIGFMNNILEELKNVEGDRKAKEPIEGEARVLRCWHIFKLLQYFAPFNDDKMGIPLNTDSESAATTSGERKSQTYIYKFLINELQEVLKFEEPANLQYNIFYTKPIIHAMMAQIYQYKAEGPAAEASDWEAAREHATATLKVIKLASTTEELNTLFKTKTKLSFSQDNQHALLVCFWGRKRSTGVYGDGMMQFGFPQKWNGLSPANKGFDLDPALAALYAPTDIRVQDDSYICKRDFNPSVCKYRSDDDKSFVVRDFYCMFRAADMHLIITESYALQGDSGNATKWLNDFKTARNAGNWSSSDVLEEILNERRKEFAFEYDYRWLDMKRYHLSLTRKYNHPQRGEVTAVLVKDDYRFSFYIPENSELGLNGNLKQNPGW